MQKEERYLKINKQPLLAYLLKALERGLFGFLGMDANKCFKRIIFLF